MGLKNAGRDFYKESNKQNSIIGTKNLKKYFFQCSPLTPYNASEMSEISYNSKPVRDIYNFIEKRKQEFHKKYNKKNSKLN